MKKSITTFAIIFSAVLCGASSRAADSILVESRKADGTANTPAWTELSGKWTVSKNKSRVTKRDASLTATNVVVCQTNVPAPAFSVTPSGLDTGTTYKVEVTFSSTPAFVAAPDLVVAVSAAGVSASTIPTNTPGFQDSGADAWTTLGTIKPSTNSPTLTFTYVSGTLAKGSRWYADAIRFTPEAVAKQVEP